MHAPSVAVSLNPRGRAADIKTVARSHSHITGAGQRRRAALGAGGASFVAGLIAASVALVVPIMLWARFGDGNPLRATAVWVAAMLLCGVVVRRVLARRSGLVTRPAAASLARSAVRRVPARARPQRSLRSRLA
jgi:hypothetical protein